MEENKHEKEHSVEERLKALYKLQTLLSEIDRIRALRGELPNEVKDLEDEIVRYQTRIQKYKDEITELKRLVLRNSADIKDRQAKIAKYTSQQDNVRNNREYDYLSKEIEFEGLEIELSEKKIREYNQAQEVKNEEIAHAQEELTDQEHILIEKKAELEEIISETKQKEETIRGEAKEIEPLIDERTLKAFRRIRDNAHNGLGVVTVQRGACGGCFNRIPPQRQLEIKMHKKVIVCEYCGRIMIDADFADNDMEA